MYDDFYGDYSPFDEEVDSFKDALKKCVKDEYIKKMERLEKENKELQDVKKNWEKIQDDFRRKENHLAWERSNLEHKIRCESLESLLSFFIKDEKLYCIKEMKFLPGTPCGKCDDTRHVSFKSPFGNVYNECCPNCSKPKPKFVIKEVDVKSLDRAWISNRNSNLGIEYYLKPENSEWIDSKCFNVEKIYKSLDAAVDFYENHDDNYYWGLSNIYFDNKSIAEQFLDFVNKKRKMEVVPDDWTVDYEEWYRKNER